MSSSKRRVAGSYFMSLMSITLVLFLLGVFALLMMHARKLSNYLKENIGFEVVMNGNVKEARIMQLQQELEAMPAVKSAEYVSKEEAIRRLSEDLGEDFLQWLGNEENPLLPSIDLRFNAEWTHPDSLERFQQRLMENKEVKEVYYQKSLVDQVHRNVNRIGFVLIVLSMAMLFVAVALIRNTIRLSIYAKRFLVRSMQLVGATRSYIRRPFVRKGVLQGFIGAVLADILLALSLYALMTRLPELTFVEDYTIIIGIFVGILLLGVLLGGLSTRLALRKYLNADVDRLYA